MPFKLETENLPVPALPKNGRSSLQQLRRMFFLRWSAGRFLTTIARNHGVQRPALGFSDDDLFRACLQVLAEDRKAIRGAFAYLLEVILGPYEDQFYQTATARPQGSGYITFEPWGDYVPYTNWNAIPFQVGERVTAVHPVTGLRTIAIVKEQDTTLNRLYFEDEYKEPDAGRFDVGHRLIGAVSGAEADAEGRVISRTYEEFPLFGQMIINPGGANEETVTFVAPDPYVGRVRVIENLANDHLAGEKILIEGGCWDFIETRARRIVIRVKCDEKNASTFPGNSYFHQAPEVEPRLRESTPPDALELRLDQGLMEDLIDESFPIRVIVNPENERLPANSGPLIVEVSAYDPASRTLFLAAPLPGGIRFVRGTKVRIYHAKTGALLEPAVIGDTTLTCRARWPNPYGIWTIDLGGGNEEKVLVVGSSYQRRVVTSPINPLSTDLWLNKTIFPIDNSHAGTLVISDSTGVLGVVAIDPNALIVDPRQVVLSAPAGFATDPSELTIAEYCRGADFGVTLTLGRPLQGAKAGAESFKEFLGTPNQVPTFDDHLVDGGWPDILTTPDGRWPGPNIFEPSVRAPYNNQGTGLVEAALDTTEANDGRIYLANTTVNSRFSPGTAVALTARTWAGQTFIPRLLQVADGSAFPPDSVIQAWLTNGTINPTGEPLRIVVSNEGTFGRTPLYLWGRGAPGSGQENVLQVSGIARTHLPGVRVATYVEELPVLGSAGFIGGDPGLDSISGTVLLDFATLLQEEIDYDGLVAVTPTRGLFQFSRGYSPAISHNPFRLDPLSGDPIGTRIVRADGQAIPRKDGFSFPFYINGGLSLYRLRFLMDAVRAAGVEVTFVDDKDRLIPL